MTAILAAVCIAKGTLSAISANVAKTMAVEAERARSHG